jgi:hypothetical protein
VWKASSDVIPTIHDTFPGLSTLRSIYDPDDYAVNTTQKILQQSNITLHYMNFKLLIIV